jgi:cytochrome P450
MLNPDLIASARRIALHTLLLRRDLFDFLDTLAAAGQAVLRVELVDGHFWLINHPDWVRQVLTAPEEAMGKPDFLLQSNRGWHGDALNTLHGDAWQARRQACARALTPELLQMVVSLTRTATLQMVRDLPQHGPAELGEPILRLLIAVGLRWILAEDLADNGGQVPWAEALGEWHDLDSAGLAHALMPQRRMRAHATPVLRRLIAEKWASAATPAPGLIGNLAQSCQAQGLRLSDEQVFDELAQWLFASHHSVTTTLINCIDRVMREAEVARRVEKAANTTKAPHTGEAKYTEHLLKEVMRFCMPTPLLFRQAIMPLQLDGHAIAAGELIAISPWLLHRDARWFAAPACFMPERFAQAINGYVFLPFGAGHRRCIAQRLALLQMKTVIETLVHSGVLTTLTPLTQLPPNLYCVSYPGPPYQVLRHPLS